MENQMSEDVIQQQMLETRASLTEKLETLEQKVVGTVENATSAVTETVDAIKESVQETVATVQEGVKDGVDTVKDAFDLPAQVQRRPWLVVGGSVAVGYCLGALLTRSSQPAYTPIGHSIAPPAPAYRASGESAVSSAEPGIWAGEVAKLKGLALGVLFGTARELLVSSMPAHLGDQVKEVVDRVTTKVGGEPLPSSDWAKLCEPVSTEDESEPEQPVASEKQTFAQPGNGHSSTRRW